MSHAATPRAGLRALAALASLKVILGAVLFAAAFATRWTQLGPRDLLMYAHVLVFGGAGGFLLRAGRTDRRATLLGTALLLTAAAFADNAPVALDAAGTGLFPPVLWVMGLQLDAFSAYVLWAFVAEFPRVPAFGARHALPRGVMQLALGVGIALFAINLLHDLVPVGAADGLKALWFPFVRDVRGATPWYWLMQYTLALPALPAMLWKARGASPSEQRRAKLLMTSLIVGSAPTVAYVVLVSVWPAVQVALPMQWAGWVLYPTLLSMPLTAGYAVLVDEALETRLIVRRAAQYALARYSLLAAASIPLCLLLVAVYQQRSSPVGELVTGTNGLLLGMLVVLAGAASRGRVRALETLDRRFFREHYDSRRILGALVEQCRGASTRAGLAESLTNEIDRALHPQSLGVLFLDRSTRLFSPLRGGIRPLPAETRLASRLRDSDVFEVDFDRPDPRLLTVADVDRHWLLDTAVRLLIPLRDLDRTVIGVIALGEKLSELPYTEEDKLLLMTVGSAASLSLAYLSVNTPVDSEAGMAQAMWSASHPVVECVQCGLVVDDDEVACTKCGGGTMPGAVPRVIAGKFRVLERIGAGGMGVVYRGIDVGLHRMVAIKTLPEVAPGLTIKLRREARTMATVTHPNLAMLYGSEAWNGIPILIEEYLAGGTLEQRLAAGPMQAADAVVMGIALADAVAALHAAGLLHRDIKPSNIGFTADGTPKLLDFGLAKFLPGATAAEWFRTEEYALLQSSSSGTGSEFATSEGRVPGTPLYLSPEAINGAEPDPSFDVWSLSVVLYEGIAGQHPAHDPSPVRAFVRITTGETTDLAELMPGVHSDVAAFFRSALAREPADRPGSAAALRQALRQLHATVGAGSAPGPSLADRSVSDV